MHARIFIYARHAYSKPNWPRSDQARDADAEGGFSVLAVAKHIQNNGRGVA